MVKMRNLCFWSIFLLLGESSYAFLNFFLQSFFGKFIALSLCWTFSFHILNEIRHLSWDLGYGFELKTTKITGVLVVLGSFIIAVSIYLLGKN